MLIRANASELKGVFKDVKPMCKKGLDAAVLGFAVESHILYITCMNGIVYEQQIVSEHPGPYSLTVLYQDLSEILPNRGVVELELAPTFVGIKSDTTSATLYQANGMVSRYKPRSGEYLTIPSAVLKRWSLLFSDTAPVSKSLQREASIIFKKPYAIMKFPTLWVQTSNDYLDTVMSLGELKAIADFLPEEYRVSSDALEFRRRAAIMAIQRNEVDVCKPVQSMLEGHCKPQKVAGHNYLPKVRQLLRSAGPGPCMCHFYPEGVSLEVSRPPVESSIKIGNCSSKSLAVLTAPLEYIQMFCKFFGEQDFCISTGSNSMYLGNDGISVLISML